jgi:hypothetical protein
LEQHLDNKVSLLSPHGFLEIGVSFRYLLSVLTWRVSNVGDGLSAHPSAVDVVTDKPSLSTYLKEALLRETAASPSAAVPEIRDGKSYLKDGVRTAMVQAFRQRVAVDIDRLRGGLSNIATSRRVRDMDEALLGVNVLATSRGITLDPLPDRLTVPLLRVPPRRQKPNSVYEVDEHALIDDLRILCRAAVDEFATVQGEVTDAVTGERLLVPAPLGLPGTVMPTGAPKNDDGKRTHARLVFPEPFNWRQIKEQISRYDEWLMQTFPNINRYEGLFAPQPHDGARGLLLPPYVRGAGAATPLRQHAFYYTRAAGPADPPSELALISREVKALAGDGVPSSRFPLELWVFTRKSGAVRRDLDRVN